MSPWQVDLRGHAGSMRSAWHRSIRAVMADASFPTACFSSYWYGGLAIVASRATTSSPGSPRNLTVRADLVQAADRQLFYGCESMQAVHQRLILEFGRAAAAAATHNGTATAAVQDIGRLLHESAAASQLDASIDMMQEHIVATFASSMTTASVSAALWSCVGLTLVLIFAVFWAAESRLHDVIASI